MAEVAHPLVVGRHPAEIGPLPSALPSSWRNVVIELEEVVRVVFPLHRLQAL
jgi:hypothetical protein